MKIWSHIHDDKLREKIIHSQQHLVIDSFIENGIVGEADSEEGKKELEELQAAWEHIKTIEDEDERIDYCFDNEKVYEWSFDLSLELCQNAYFAEEGELVISLDQVHNCFEDDEEIDEVVDVVVDNDKEGKTAEIIPFPTKDKKSLN